MYENLISWSFFFPALKFSRFWEPIYLMQSEMQYHRLVVDLFGVSN